MTNSIIATSCEEEMLNDPLLALRALGPCSGRNTLKKCEVSKMMMTKSGTGVFEIETYVFPIRRGDIFIIPKGASYRIARSLELELYYVLFDMEALQFPRADIAIIPGYNMLFPVKWKDTDNQYDSFLHLNEDLFERVISLVMMIEKEADDKSPAYIFIAIAYFIELVVLLTRSYTKENPMYAQAIKKMSESIRYIQFNYTHDMTISNIAEAGKLSKSTLLRLFKRVYGLTPIAYINKLRIFQAQTLLRDTDISIAELAFDLGFQDSNYFSKVFKAYTHMSPREYRAYMRADR